MRLQARETEQTVPTRRKIVLAFVLPFTALGKLSLLPPEAAGGMLKIHVPFSVSDFCQLPVDPQSTQGSTFLGDMNVWHFLSPLSYKPNP